MRGILAGDFNNSQRSMSTVSYPSADTGEISWKRSVKRRHGGASHEDEKGVFFRDVPTSTRSSHACEMTHPEDVDVRFELQKPGNISCETVDFSGCDAFAQNPGSRSDNNSSQRFPRPATLTRCQPPRNIQQPNREALSRKRNYYQPSHEQDEEPLAYQEITMLRKALKSERDALQMLYIDLEEERCASKTAADEAIAMIMRLQEEKSAALMEARQYQRVAEEREYYNQQTIALLKDALLKKEYLFLSLQEQINGCKEMLMRSYSGKVRGQANFLKYVPMKEKLLLLESHEVNSSSNAGIADVQYQVSENDGFHSDYLHQSEVPSVRCHYPVVSDGRVLNLIDDAQDFQLLQAEMHHDVQNQAFYSSDHTLFGTDKFWVAETGSITSTNVNAQSRNHINRDIDQSRQEDMGLVILDRLRHLEERLDFICHNQMPHHESFKHSSSLYDMEPESYEWENPPEAPQMEKYLHSPSIFEHERKRSSYDKPIMRSLSRETGRSFDSLPHHNQEECPLLYEGVNSIIEELKCRDWETDMNKAVNHDDVGDGIHDIYEVHEIKESTPHSDDFLCQIDNGRYKSEAGSVGTDESEEASKMHKKQGKCEVDDSKLSVEFSALNVFKSVEDSDVGQLKLRLQALEGERVFMKEAIESLRKENMELKLLREIAQQLRELKGDVKKAGGSETSCRLPFLSFLRGFMSFTGIENSPNTEGIRSCNSFHRNSVVAADTQGGGLREVLNKVSEEPKSGYVMREYKIKIET